MQPITYSSLFIAFLLPAGAQVVTPAPTFNASSRSVATRCAEEDNVNIPASGCVKSFVVEATHPGYPVGTDNCAADFTNCSATGGASFSFSPGVRKLFDDGTTVVEAVTEKSWWRPNGMAVTVQAQTAEPVHYVRLYRKIAGASEWPQVLVLYQDGNLRLIPQPPAGVPSVCFGSSLLVGPAAAADRPVADIRAVKYLPATQTLEVSYTAGGSAAIALAAVSRTVTRVAVTLNYRVGEFPAFTFRSMFVEGGNADVDRVRWTGADGVAHDDPVLQFAGGASAEFFFYRRERSRHNTSAPDLRVRATDGQPAVFARGAVNAASFTEPAAPGAAISIFGCGLGPAAGVAGTPGPNGRLAPELAGVKAWFNGVPAPLWYVRSGQINALVPYAAQPPSAELQVEYAGERSQPVTVPVAAAAAGLFTLDASGKGQAAALNQDSTINSPGNAAARGDLVSLFATGEGQTDPPGEDGRTPVAPLPRPVFPVFVSIGGAAADIAFVGSAPGFAGLLQINARIPAQIAPGAVPVIVKVNARESQPGVTLAVK